jgi:spore germination protein YaaH
MPSAAAPLRFSACLTHWDGASLASFEAHAGLLTRVYPFWYAISVAGLPMHRRDSPAALRQRVGDGARAAGVELWPLVSSFDPQVGTYNPALMRLVMGDPSTRRAHIARLLEYALADGAQGLNLDYEDLYDVDRASFGAFVEEICARFHAKGLKVGIALSTTNDQLLQDCARLGRACDSVQVLCMGYHGATGGPGPLSPPDWAKAVMAQALSQVPAEKLEFGLPGQGYLWGPAGSAQSVTWQGWDALRQAHPPERRDPATAELTLNFDGYEVWFNDSISLTAKLYQIRDLGLDQASLWTLGGEDPRLWALLETLPKPFLRQTV